MEGWICPVCHSIYAPFFPWCLKCNNFNLTQKEIQKNTTDIIDIITPTKIETTQTLKEETVAEDIKKKKIHNKILIKERNEKLIQELKFPNTKIFLTGLAHNKGMAISLPFAPPFILDSFFEFPLTFTKLVDDYFLWIKNNNIEYILDSGAFSYLNNPKKELDLDHYIERYINFIKNYNITKFFEIDLDHIIGYNKVLEINRHLYQQLNIEPIPVWHKSRGKEKWRELCQNYDFIAIGGIASREITLAESKVLLPELCDEAHAYNVKVHGLGHAPLELLNSHTLYFDTIDTTSWNKGRRNKHCEFKDNKILVLDGTLYGTDSRKNQTNDLEAWVKFIQYYYNYRR